MHPPKDFGCRVSYHHLISHTHRSRIPYNRILSHILAALSPHIHHPLSPICPPHCDFFCVCFHLPLLVPCPPSHSANCTITLGSQWRYGVPVAATTPRVYYLARRFGHTCTLPAHVYTLTQGSFLLTIISCWLRLVFVFTQCLVSSQSCQCLTQYSVLLYE